MLQVKYALQNKQIKFCLYDKSDFVWSGNFQGWSSFISDFNNVNKLDTPKIKGKVLRNIQTIKTE